MEIVYLVHEFFADLTNLIPSGEAMAIASVGLILFSRHVRIQRPAIVSLGATVIATLALFAVLLISTSGFGGLALDVMGASQFWVGLVLTVLLAWPMVGLIGLLLSKRQRRAALRDTSAFQ